MPTCLRSANKADLAFYISVALHRRNIEKRRGKLLEILFVYRKHLRSWHMSQIKQCRVRTLSQSGFEIPFRFCLIQVKTVNNRFFWRRNNRFFGFCWGDHCVPTAATGWKAGIFAKTGFRYKGQRTIPNWMQRVF